MIRLFVHNIRSHYNVGAMFRTADGAGAGHVYLSGYTPAPLDRFGRAVPELAKTALGAEAVLPWTVVSDPEATLRALRAEGVTIVVVEQAAHAISLYDFVPPQDVVYVLGSETEGVPQELIELADTVVEIPMQGKKESLNVSVAAGIVLYHR